MAVSVTTTVVPPSTRVIVERNSTLPELLWAAPHPAASPAAPPTRTIAIPRTLRDTRCAYPERAARERET
jgi:hypothetical protein